jgi:purine-binding chemotaxis protein CheW
MSNYLSFSIAGEICAVEIADVETVIEGGCLSRVSGAPDYVAGLLDLRGEAVPVIDVRRKLGLEPMEGRALPSIIVLSLKGCDGARKPAGALVDSVSEVIDIPEGSIMPVGEFAVALDERVVRGIAKREAGFITMIAAGRLFEPPPAGPEG